MGYWELFQESPALFFLVLIISLVVTLFVYGAFPIIFAKVRKTPITKKKYKWLCYGINFIGVILFVALDGGVSGGPYILWTWIFSNYGVKILEAKGLLSDASPAVLKSLFDNDSDSLDLGTGGFGDRNKPLKRAAVCKKIVNYEYLIIGREKFF